MSDVADILGPGGLLARALPGYEPRAAQVQMAEREAVALAERRPLVVEAGTGTGKTLAYLDPALLSGLKVIVSTGTKNLQEQIYKKDLPLLADVLPRPFSAAYMKGLSNYLCRRRFAEADARHAVRLPVVDDKGQTPLFATRTMRLPDEPAALDELFEMVRSWAGQSDTGDRAELSSLPDDAPLWRDIAATAETRLGPRCAYFESCFVTQARRRAQAADLVVVNHHLFFADLALRSRWPQAQLLPSYEAVIFDEAHQVEDIASDYFGVSVSSSRVTQLTRDLRRAVTAHQAPPRLEAASAHVDARATSLIDSLRGKIGKKERVAVTAETWRGEPEQRAWALDTALEEVEAMLAGARAGSDGSGLEDGGQRAEILERRARALRDDLALLVEGAQKIDRRHVFWAESSGGLFKMHASPVDVADVIREEILAKVESAVFTSATLTSGGTFEFVRARLGLQSADEARLPSPFDYRQQAVLYLPRDLPPPTSDQDRGARDARTEALAQRMAELVDVTDGRAFLLFTSHRQMEAVHAILKQRLSQPLLLQGSKPKHLLIEEFRQRIGSVLFATASFWEGVDVVGEALSLVVMDKLPFAPPDDPLVEARCQRLTEAEQDPFYGYQVPRAALALAQGFGRLIRHRSDRGIVALLDPRATQRAWGRRVLESLPADCPRTASLDDVKAFWARVRAPIATAAAATA